MNTEEKINRAVELFQSLGLTELSMKDGDFAIELKRSSADIAPAAALPIVTAPAVEAVPVAQPPAANAPVSASAPASGVAVKAPMLGVFYAASSPDAEPFVKVGDSVKKGDILCIIEAMKMMNEITADEDGVVSEIKAENGKIVEYGQTLFVLN